MIEQYLSNTNERATVSILQNILELNKALVSRRSLGVLINKKRYIVYASADREGAITQTPSHTHGAFSVFFFPNPRFVCKLQEKTNKQPAAASAETDARWYLQGERVAVL